MHEIWQTATREDAEQTFDQFIVTYEAKYPKATNLLKDRQSLMTIYDFPAVHWQHRCKTTNPIESIFATIHRSTRMKGYVTRDSLSHMMIKLGQCPEKKTGENCAALHTWRRLLKA